ncbi:unnamed protein product [Candidula unifasciata]|uniref:Ferritin n=1 Tax=Candidula unifasciata TaxID=100452 RepID=A0A8S3YK56_9EUPU|nr:unnamed protein product [Candidula unifasciata]
MSFTLTTSVFAVLTALVHVVAAKEFVDNVRQHYAENINDLLVKQIQKELSASYIYQGYASYFDRADVSLPGVAKFFSGASLEEREHAQSLIDYINKRGGHAQFEKIDLKASCELVWNYLTGESSDLGSFASRRMCICGFVTTQAFNAQCEERSVWKEALMAFEDALAIERFVNKELLDLHKEADARKDAHLAHILEHEFLEEQVSSISKLARYVTRLRSFAGGNNYKLGEYIFDQHLS